MHGVARRTKMMMMIIIIMIMMRMRVSIKGDFMMLQCFFLLGVWSLVFWSTSNSQ